MSCRRSDLRHQMVWERTRCLGVSVATNRGILALLVEFAETLVNRYEVGHDKKPPHERLRGKSSRLLVLEFEKLVSFLQTPVRNRLTKLDSS